MARFRLVSAALAMLAMYFMLARMITHQPARKSGHPPHCLDESEFEKSKSSPIYKHLYELVA